MPLMRYVVQEIVAFVAACSLMVALAKALSLTSTVGLMAPTQTSVVGDAAQASKSTIPVGDRENHSRRAHLAK